MPVVQFFPISGVHETVDNLRIVERDEFTILYTTNAANPRILLNSFPNLHFLINPHA